MEIMVEADVLTLAALGAAVALAALSVLMLRMRQKRHSPAGWIPWNGLLFAAIVIAAISFAHLFGIERR